MISNEGANGDQSGAIQRRVALDLAATLNRYGADKDRLILLDDGDSKTLKYSTLVAARAAPTARGDKLRLNAVAAVYEWQDAPLIFIVNGPLSELELSSIRRVLAMRGDAPYMGVLDGGTLKVFELNLDKNPIGSSEVTLGVDEHAWATMGNLAYRRIAADRLQDEPNKKVARVQANRVSRIILSLLKKSIKTLVTGGVGIDDAISFVGRALFARFLVDRGLFTERSVPGVEPEKAFDDKRSAETLCGWLDQTFNGNLLPLSAKAWELLSQNCLLELGNIMHRAEDGQLQFSWKDDWNHLDFSHIPVGVLSQAYEDCLENFDKKRKKSEASYYTPAPIAEMLTKAAFASFSSPSEAAAAKVLDPAVGAGIFLIQAFTEIVAARWKAEGVRPNTEALRDILYKQLKGFDVNEAALRFSALGLYLAAIEFDPSPEPVQKLKFKNLRETTLHLFEKMGSDDEAIEEIGSGGRKAPVKMLDVSHLGSLGPNVPSRYDGIFDIVLGNPPWSKAPGNLSLKPVQEVVDEIVNTRAKDVGAVGIPERSLDIAFLWRATRWAKPGGRIAFAMHARLLFLHNEEASQSRKGIFQSLDVQAVINGADLRGTAVWPNIAAQFCLLIARNRRASPGGGFRFLSPRRETGLNASGVMRIDADSADYIPVALVQEFPDVFKVLFRGSHADLRILRRIDAINHPTMFDVWSDENLRGDHRLLSGNGYQTVRPSTTNPHDASELIGQPVVDARQAGSSNFDLAQLPTFNLPFLHRRRNLALYNGPILLAFQSPTVTEKRITTAFLEANVVFSESLNGWQVNNDVVGTRTGRYLSLLIGSKVALWIILMRGAKFGIEREVVEKSLIEQLPIPRLNGTQWDIAENLFKRAATAEEGIWKEVDDWAAKLFHLNDDELQTIKDTLEYNLTYSDIREDAERPVSADVCKVFVKTIEAELRPWLALSGLEVGGSVAAYEGFSAWRAFTISVGVTQKNVPPNFEMLHRAADRLACTQLIMERDGPVLHIARLNQARYWTVTKARALAAEIVLSHMNFLQGEAA